MYIPISNIIETNFTNGGQFVIRETQKEYSGFYHKDINNNFWTGKTHTDSSVLLDNINTSQSIDWTKYNSISGNYTKLNPKVLPPISFTPDFIFPTEQDYNNSYFIRYILKPTISTQTNDFIEVKVNKYQEVLKSKDLQTLYLFANVTWKLTGPLHDVYRNNIRTISGIIDTNKRSIQEAEKFIPHLSLYFTDLKQFGRPS